MTAHTTLLFENGLLNPPNARERGVSYQKMAFIGLNKRGLCRGTGKPTLFIFLFTFSKIFFACHVNA
jgi:hypothetical protein